MKLAKLLLSLAFLMFLIPACGDDVGGDDHADEMHDGHDDHGHDDHGHDHHGHDHENEVMTAVILSFVPASGGDALEFKWSDPEQDGMPVIDPINLTLGETYTVSVIVANELEDPIEILTEELQDEAEEHQFFFTGDAVSSPAQDNENAIMSQEYADMDNDGYPIGLENTITATAAGSGELNVMLRHMPLINGSTVKTANLAELVKNGQVDELPGNIDIEITFEVTVQ